MNIILTRRRIRYKTHSRQHGLVMDIMLIMRIIIYERHHRQHDIQHRQRGMTPKDTLHHPVILYDGVKP